MKKFLRKSKRHQNALLREGISTVDDIKNNLVICNAGLVNGLSEELLINSFARFGPIENILMVPGKSYCFVSFENEESAESCYSSCNGKLNIAQDQKPIFLCYVDVLPKIEDERNWNSYPPGLIILENFISIEEEVMMMNLVKFNSDTESDRMKNRQVKHFGFEFKYDSNNVDKTDPLTCGIPEECNFLWSRLGEKCEEFNSFFPDQLTINHYSPGQGIPSHVDTHSAFEDPIISLSLGSSVVMDFKKENEHFCLVLPRRSLTVMSKESRYLWTHGITPRKFDVIKKNGRCDLFVREARISFTFRKLLNTDKCNCGFASKFCDSKNNKVNDDRNLLSEEVASKLERIHVHQVYESIADHFSDTRHKPWPNILRFIESLEKGSILVDVGCGNGKYLGINKDIFGLGCDRSFGLVDVCKVRGFESLSCDCLSIPLRDEIADACICIAVIHHLATESRRLKAIKEILRILKPQGKALIYVWAKDQISNNKKSNYIKEEKKVETLSDTVLSESNNSIVDGVNLPVHTNRTEFKHTDLLVPWKLKKDDKNKGTFLRYYHVYEEKELENDCRTFSNLKVTSSYYDQGNWCVMFEKLLDNKRF